MKDLVVSLETAEKLKAAGWKKRTYFRWLIKNNGSLEPQIVDFHTLECSEKHYTYFPCPTFEEVFRELPHGVSGFYAAKQSSEKYLVTSSEWDDGFGGDIEPPSSENKSLSEAAAQMWLWCVENGYIKP